MSNVREFMTANPVTISKDGTLEEAARLMRQHDIGVLPVTDGQSFHAVITDRDIVVKALADGRMNVRVGDIATREVVSVSPDDDVREAARVMAQSDVRRVPVCVDGQLVGIVSVGDLATRQDPAYAGQVMEQTGPET